MDFFLVSLSNVSAFTQYSSRVWDVRHFFCRCSLFYYCGGCLEPIHSFSTRKSVCHTRAGWVGLFLFMFKLGLFVWPVANGWWLFVLR
jgi:hypothetical protein